MNEIVMLPITALRHHPENPRIDLGDLTELAASIKQNGIMQNLTVVRPTFYSEGDDDIWWVVIGNRRLEAGTMAGLEFLPCVISDMDQKTQIATMIQENMQRADLTVYEQAQGFQMMLDLGYKPEKIAEQTGISETTVRRRLKMAELDKDALKKACEIGGTERQITLGDFDRLAKVEDVQKRNELLKSIGGHNFEWLFTKAIREQKTAAVLPEVKKILKASKLKKLDKSERWSDKYERVKDLQLYDWVPGTELIPACDEPLFYLLDDDSLSFRKKKKRVVNPENVKSEEEKAEERAKAEAWEQIKKDSDAARQLRREFADKLTVTMKNAPDMLRHLMIAASLSHMTFRSYYTEIKNLLGLNSDSCLDMDSQTAAVLAIKKMPMLDWPKIIRIMFDPNGETGYYTGYQREFPRWQDNATINAYYGWLIENGYQLSDVEEQLKNGTHPSFRRAE